MMSFSLKFITVIFLFNITVNLYATTVQSLTAPLTAGYESNPLLSVSDKNAISIIAFTPSYSITSRSGPNQWHINTSIRLERSSNKTISQDRNDPSLNLNWQHNYETGQFSVNGILNEQSSRVTQFTDRGIVEGDNTQKTRTISATWQNSLTDRTLLSVGADATTVTFSGATTAGLVNYRNESSNVRLDYSLAEKTEIFTQLSYLVYKPETASNLESNSKSVDFGVTWNANETFNLMLSAGLNESQTKNMNSNQNWQASLTAQYSTVRTSTRLSLSRSQTPSSIGSLIESNQLNVGWTYSLSEREKLTLDYIGRKNLTINNIETKQVSANYTRELNISWDFRFSLGHIIREDKLTDVSSSSVMASIVYKLPDF